MTTPEFRTFLRAASSDIVLIPMLRVYFRNPTFDTYQISVSGLDVRPPDGWFHPSAHPLMPERQLYYYLTADPADLDLEDLEQESSFSIIQGHFWHEVLQHAMLDLGVIDASEVHVEDREVGSRGSMDGTRPGEVVEIKTINGYKIKEMVHAEALREKKPGYYAQAQEYMRMSGLRVTRFLFINPNYPFPMNEFTVPYDEPYAEAVARKFRRVRQAVADQRLPEACCNPGSKEAKMCFARSVCPVGRMSK